MHYLFTGLNPNIASLKSEFVWWWFAYGLAMFTDCVVSLPRKLNFTTLHFYMLPNFSDVTIKLALCFMSC